MITGRSAPDSSSAARSMAAVRARPPGLGAAAGARAVLVLGLGGLHEHVVEREVHERRAAVGRDGGREGVVDQARDLLGGGGAWRRAWSAAARTGRGRSPAASPGPSASPGPVRRARPSASGWPGAEAIALMPLVTPGPAVSAHTPGLAGHLRPALGGERGGRLVADVHDRDALLAAAVVDREQVPAREREQLAHAVRLQAPATSRPPWKVSAAVSWAVSRRLPADSIRRDCSFAAPDQARCPGWDSNPHALAGGRF